MSDEPSTGELMRRLERFERHVDARFDQLATNTTSLERFAALEARVAGLEERLRWFVRTLVAAGITAGIGALVLIAQAG